MIALYVQTVVLLTIAYFLGAILAYWIRRSLFKPAVPLSAAERRVDPLPEFADRGGSVRPPVATAPAPAPTPKPAPPIAQAQDLRSIRLIDEAAEALLKRHGVSRYEQIATWTPADVARFGALLGDPERIAHQNWIEQAQVLAKGGVTEFARRRMRGEIASAVPSPDVGRELNGMATSVASAIVRPQASTAGAAAVVAQIVTSTFPPQAAAPEPPPAAPAAPSVAPPDVAERAAFAVEAPRAAVPIRPQAAAPHDNLQRIGHVDAAMEKALHARGVQRYAHIARWSPAEVDRLDAELGLGGRIARENWIEQAQILARGGDTAYSRNFDRQHGIPPRPLHAVNLVDAIRANAPAASAVSAAPAAPRPQSVLPRPRADDLKRIRGIGLLTEQKLNAMDVKTYEAIANWSAADVERIARALDFPGRISNENWIEQARILDSGGTTEHSRRYDDGLLSRKQE